MKIIHGKAFGSASQAPSSSLAVVRPEAIEAPAPRDLIADTSHELRAPLSVLGGLIETLSELDLDAERSRQYLDLMAQQCKRMRAIVDGLLELSTLEGKADAGPGERVDIASLLARLRAEAEVLCGRRLSVVLEAQTGFDLLGDERDITSAIGNLVTNAVRYTPPGGEIRLTWRASARGGECSVQDTGVGIDEKHLPLLTERFYRVQQAVQAAGRRGAGGAGLGLAIVKAALARHQATLEIRSEAGKGSCFTARFPAHRVLATGTSIEGIAA